MLKKGLLLLMMFCVSSVTATNYYYNQSGGNDANDCSTPALACKTITDMDGKGLAAGDTVYFARGETWRTISEYDAEITVRSGSSSGNVTYRAYGSGATPIFMRSREMNGAGNWTNIYGNVWRSTVTFSDDVGVCVFNNSIDKYSSKVEAIGSNLNSQNKFYYNTTDDKIYIYSVGNPASLQSDIECSKKGNVFNLVGKNYIVVRDIDMRYSAKTCVYMEDVHHVEILNNSCLFAGGSYQSGTLRYGNCIEYVSDGNYSKVNYNNVTQCWDAGVSNQDNGHGNYINLEYRYNIIKYSIYCYEFFNKATTSVTMNNVFDHNTCYKTGYGFNPAAYGRNFRTGVQAGHLSGFNITNNIMHDSSQYNIQINDVFNDTFLKLDYNLYYESSPSSGFIDWKSTYYTYENFATYQAAKSQDAHSRAANPLLNTTTLAPASNSSACGNASDGGDIGALPCQGAAKEPEVPALITYSDNSTNSTLAGTYIQHRLKWTSSEGLAGYIFSFCNATWNGTHCPLWVNDSFVTFSGLSNWSNVTKNVNTTVGKLIAWCVYANDTLSNWNTTSCVSPFTYNLTAPPSSPPTINYSQAVPYSMTFETGANTTIWQTYDNSTGNNCYTGTASNKANWSTQEGDDDTYYGAGSLTMYGINPDANYIAYLQTPIFTLNGSTAYVHYNWRHDYEVNYDGSYIEYMFNNSGTWTKVTTSTAVNFTTAPYSTYDGYGGYGRSQSACQGNFFSTDRGEFIVNLTIRQSTGNVTLRFNTIGDANTLCTTPPCGVWLDDFNITYSPLGEDEPPSPPTIVYPFISIADRALFIRSGVVWV